MMRCAGRVLLVLLLSLLATPALSAVERFTDTKGFIHITNNAPKEQEHPNEKTTVQEEKESVGSQDLSAHNLTKFTDTKGTIHLTNLPAKNSQPQQIAEAKPEPSLPEEARPKLPVATASLASKMQNSWNDRQASVLTDLPASPKKPASSHVKKFEDRQGIIHITNGGRKPEQMMVAGWSSKAPMEKAARPARSAVKPVKGVPETRLVKPAHMAMPSPPPILTAGPGPPARHPPVSCGALVHRFRDTKGVMHIVSEPRTKPETLPHWPGGIVPRKTMSRLCAATMELNRVAGRYAGGTLLVRKDKQGKTHITNVLPFQNRGKARAREHLKPILVEAALTYGLPVPLIEAVIKAESNFRAQAVSPKGAMGLMQLMPGTAKFLGVKNPFCPRENVMGGCRYLRLLLDSFNQSLPLALAAYNAGFKRVINAGFKVPDIKETKAFVTQIVGNYSLAIQKGRGMNLRL